MPAAAIATGEVDAVLPLGAIGPALLHLATTGQLERKWHLTVAARFK
jgi:chemotaxis response regulator CheB